MNNLTNEQIKSLPEVSTSEIKNRKTLDNKFLKPEVRESGDAFYINFNAGLGWGVYPKSQFTLEEAFEQIDDEF